MLQSCLEDIPSTYEKAQPPEWISQLYEELGNEGWTYSVLLPTGEHMGWELDIDAMAALQEAQMRLLLFGMEPQEELRILSEKLRLRESQSQF